MRRVCSHLTSECLKSPETPAKCCNCSGEHPASFSQCPAYTKYLAKRVQITSRDDINVTTTGNKNLHAKITNSKNVTRQSESQEVGPDRVNNPLINAKRNINRFKERQIYTLSKSYFAAVNNTNMTVNDDLSDLNGLMFEIQKLKQLNDIPYDYGCKKFK